METRVAVRPPGTGGRSQPDGDVIVRYDNTDIAQSDELVAMVTRTKPGTAVPVEVIRAGQRQTLRLTVGTLDLADDGGAGEASDTRFGMSLQDLSLPMRNQLDVPSGRAGVLVERVEQAGAAARAGIRAGDVILDVNRSPVSSAAEATVALRRVPETDPAFVLVRQQGQELFLTMARQ